MDENTAYENPVTEDAFELLPDGWTAGTDIFSAAFSANDGGVTGENADGGVTSPALAGELSENAETDPAEPTTPAHGKSSAKLKFSATVDHQKRDVELDEEQLPEMYQKAQVVDRVQAKLARISPVYEQAERISRLLGYETAGDMLADAENRVPLSPDAPARDFEAEVETLVKAKPRLLGAPLPEEVVNDCVKNGKPLIRAYLDYEQGRREASDTMHRTALDAVRSENESLRANARAFARENRALRQNAEAAGRAPVRGVSGGGATDTRPGDDPFLKGFDSDGW